MHFELSDLAIFLSLSRTLNMGETSEEMHRTGAAVSLRLKKLEASFGCRLFFRRARGLELTPAGRALCVCAQNVMEEVRILESAMESYRESERARVRVASNSTFLQTCLSPLAAHYLKRRPVRFVFSETRTEEGAARLRAGAVDVVVGREDVLRAHLPHTMLEHLTTDRHVLIVANGHELANESAMPFERVLNEPFIAFPRTSAIGRAMAGRFQEAHAAYEPVVEVPTFAAAIDMAAAGVGVAVVPYSSVTDREDVSVIDLTDTWAFRPLAIAAAAPGSRSEAVDDFVRFVKRHFEAQRNLPRP